MALYAMAFFVWIALLLAPLFSFAGDAYQVSGVQVEVAGGDLNRVRSSALDVATQQGLVQLLQQLTPRSTWHRHESIIEQINADAALASFNIVSERNEGSKGNYYGEFDLQYNQNMIRDVLSRNSIPFAEAGVLRAVIVPVLSTPDTEWLWSDLNPWLKAMQNKAGEYKDTLFTPVVPAGNAGEAAILSPTAALSGATDQLAQLAGMYDAQVTIVAKASLEKRGQGQFLEVSGSWYGTPEPVAPVGVSVPLDSGTPFDIALQQASERFFDALATRWRTAGLVRVDQPGRVYVRIHPESAAQLNAWQKELGLISAVRSTNVRLLSSTRAVLELNFYGAPVTLEQQLMNAGWEVAPEGGLWVLNKKS